MCREREWETKTCLLYAYIDLQIMPCTNEWKMSYKPRQMSDSTPSKKQHSWNWKLWLIDVCLKYIYKYISKEDFIDEWMTKA